MERYQQQAYAMRRMTFAVDRMILAKSPEAKEVALDWVSAWAILAMPASVERSRAGDSIDQGGKSPPLDLKAWITPEYRSYPHPVSPLSPLNLMVVGWRWMPV